MDRDEAAPDLTLQTSSFVLAALVFGSALLWALRSRSEPVSDWRTRLSFGCGLIWALLFPSASWLLLSISEISRYGAWLLLLPVLLRRVGPAASRLRRFNTAIWLAALAVAVINPVLLILVLAFAGLVNIEQLLRSAEPEEKRGVKLCAVGLGGVFAYDLYCCAEYILLRTTESAVWDFRGYVNAALMPFVMLGMSRLSRVQHTLFVSRQVAFYTTAFLAVGLYLIGIALVAQSLRGQEGVWAQWMEVLLLAGAGLVLVVLLSTESPWRRLRVFIAKHFYSNKYDYRVEWLRFVRTLGNEEKVDARVTAIRAIAQIFESPVGALFLREEGEGAYSAVATWTAEAQPVPNLPPLPLDHDLARFMAAKEWVIDLDEYRANPAIYASLTLPGFLVSADSPWRIVSPLLERERILGLILLQRPPDPFLMTFEDRDLLRMVGRHVATLLAQQAADRRLAEGRQFDAFNRFAAFVMHDLKNSAAQLQLLARNAARHRSNPEFIDDAFATIENTADRITRLIAQLQSRDARAGYGRTSLNKVLQTALERCSAQPPVPECDVDASDTQLLADPERLTAVFEHVIRNGQQAAGASGKVKVSVRRDVGAAVVTIADTGSGMDPEFVRERLFRPFDTTKGGAGMGIGAYQAREYVREVGGSMEVQSRPGSGTRFIIRLPQCKNSNES